MQFWKDYTYASRILLELGVMSMSAIWKKRLKTFVHDFKGSAKNEITKINKIVVGMASNLNSSSKMTFRSC